jgi:hypothetical protein
MIGVLALGLAVSPAWARGPAPPKTGTLATPQPVRAVHLASVGTKPFQLPNGSRVDLAADLDTLFLTAVASTPSLSPLEAGAPDACERRLEVRAAISTLDVDVADIGVHFGYTPSGETSTITSLQGTLGVKIGTLAMDFSLWECAQGRCTAVAATTATQATAGMSLSFDIQFSQITTGPALVFNTPLGDTIRKIMQKGMQDLGASPRLVELPWQATVRLVQPSDGTFIFDAGFQQRLAPQQTFVVYAAQSGGGTCDVFKAVAYTHTLQVDPVSSVATVDQSFDARGIQVGDAVMVRVAPAGAQQGAPQAP